VLVLSERDGLEQTASLGKVINKEAIERGPARKPGPVSITQSQDARASLNVVSVWRCAETQILVVQRVCPNCGTIVAGYVTTPSMKPTKQIL
jgi:hypothetical protein